MTASVSRGALKKRRPDPKQDKDTALQVMVPSRVKRQVSVRAAQEGTTQRTIILSALRAIGFDIQEEELCDKRKVR
jgi:hypothetical protein